MQRGARLQQQMADALNPSSSAWEQIHGMHHVPKTYVPPFMKDEYDQMNESSPEKIKDKLYDMQVEDEALNPFKEDDKKKGTKGIDLNKAQNLEDLPISEAERRQIKDMKFIRVRVKTLHIESDELISQLHQDTFSLSMNLPLPDIHKKKMSDQQVSLSNYESLQHNVFAFNSLSLYNFRVDEDTLQQFVGSNLQISIKDHGVSGSLAMNKLLMAHDFKLEATVELEQSIPRNINVGKKAQKASDMDVVYAGRLLLEINLQSGDTEDEMKRNFQIKQQKLDDIRAQEEADKQEALRRKMQFVMEQTPVFGQLYLHIEKLG